LRSVVGRLTDDRSVTVLWTERGDGDFALPPEGGPTSSIRTALVDRQWVWAQQVHGAQVSIVDELGADRADRTADVLVTIRDDVVLEVRTADCVAIGLWSDDGVVGAVHCGWRGLEAGVLDAAVSSLRDRSGAPLHAVLGPSIGPECYEFGIEDRRRIAVIAGDQVLAETGDGRPALDVRAGVRASLIRLGVDIVGADDRCTACDSSTFWSHRARSDAGRHVLAIWIGDR
jgi:YfiH family protein